LIASLDRDGVIAFGNREAEPAKELLGKEKEATAQVKLFK
jgi:hypothetical protein